MIACISPCDVDLHETISTLQYAAKTKQIQNRLVANVATVKIPKSVSVLKELSEPDEQQKLDGTDVLCKLQDQIKALQAELVENKHASSMLQQTHTFRRCGRDVWILFSVCFDGVFLCM